MATQDTEKREGVAALERALTLLNVFDYNDQALTLHELAKRTGYYKSTILRFLASLIRFGCIQQLPDGRYQLGYTLLHWGSVYQASLRLENIVVPVLERLTQATGEGASYFRREGDVRLCLYRVDSHRSVRDHMHAGEILPLGMGAAGRALVEYEPDYSPKPSSPVRVTVGEREPDIAAVAAPVYGPDHRVRGAVAISGPASRFTDEIIDDFKANVIHAAADLTQRLGGNPCWLEGGGG